MGFLCLLLSHPFNSSSESQMLEQSFRKKQNLAALYKQDKFLDTFSQEPPVAAVAVQPDAPLHSLLPPEQSYLQGAQRSPEPPDTTPGAVPPAQSVDRQWPGCNHLQVGTQQFCADNSVSTSAHPAAMNMNGISLAVSLSPATSS